MNLTITGNTAMRYGNVCMSGFDSDSGRYLRILKGDGSHFKDHEVRQNLFLPFNLIQLDVLPQRNLPSPPHIEDIYTANWKFIRGLKLPEIERFLERISNDSIESIYERPFAGRRSFSIENPPPRSLGTIELAEAPVVLFCPNPFESGKHWFRVGFVDLANAEISEVPIVDLRLRSMLLRGYESNKGYITVQKKINKHLAEARRVFLRVGLSRAFSTAGGPSQYWLEATGIYPIPDFYPVPDYRFWEA